jgi:hypothetical protein
MVGMGIRTHKAHGHIGVTGALNLPAGKHSRAVGINQTLPFIAAFGFSLQKIFVDRLRGPWNRLLRASC